MDLDLADPYLAIAGEEAKSFACGERPTPKRAGDDRPAALDREGAIDREGRGAATRAVSSSEGYERVADGVEALAAGRGCGHDRRTGT